jgi:hypothetical protein
VEEKQSLLVLKEHIIQDISEQFEVFRSQPVSIDCKEENLMVEIKHLRSEQQEHLAEIASLTNLLNEKEDLIQYTMNEIESIKDGFEKQLAAKSADFEEKARTEVTEYEQKLREAAAALIMFEEKLDYEIRLNEELRSIICKLESEKENISSVSTQRMHTLAAIVTALNDELK